MTTDEFHSDLLSAFFDGETTPDERAEAERLRDASPVAQRELGEVALLSDWLRDISTESAAPPELSERVLAATLPHRSAAGANRRAAVTLRSSHAEPGTRSGAVLSIIASAAVLLLCVGLLWRSEWSGRSPGPLSGDDEVARSGGWQGEKESPDFDSGIDLADSSSSRLAPTHAVATRGPSAAERRFIESLSEEDSSTQDIARLVEEIPEDVSIVEVSVVDVGHAAKTLERLLDQQAIPVASRSSNGLHQPWERRRPAGDDSANSESDDSQSTAVYVQANESQVAAVLKQIEEEPFVVAVHVAEPVLAKKWQGAEIAEFEASEPKAGAAPTASLRGSRSTEGKPAEHLAPTQERGDRGNETVRFRNADSSDRKTMSGLRAEANATGTNTSSGEARSASGEAWRIRMNVPNALARRLSTKSKRYRTLGSSQALADESAVTKGKDAVAERRNGRRPVPSKPPLLAGARNSGVERDAERREPTKRILFLFRASSLPP